MDKQTYLKKFSRIVHWKLPKSEADEVLADYDDIFSQYSGSNEDLPIQEFGAPAQAAQQLSAPESYHRWFVVFGFLTFCLLLSEFLLLQANFNHSTTIQMYILLGLGLAVSLIWFRPRQGEEQKAPFPQKLFPLLLGLFALVIAVAIIMVCLIIKVGESISPVLYSKVAYWTLLSTGTVATLLGLFGLIQARLSDYRWCSLYVISLTALVECVLALALLINMSLDTSSAGWWVPYVTNFGIVDVAGLIGVGVSLC